MIENFRKLIEASNNIIIFRHLVGDGDALGSQWGLYYYLKEKYPSKKIYAVGDKSLGYEKIFEDPQQIDDDKFTDAVGIVLDTANTARISDQRYKLCKKLVKIDHHLEVESYADVEFVYPKVTSTSEILANILKQLENDKPLSAKVARNLYTGIISDTQMFSIPGVNEATFNTAAYLSKSNIEVGKISRDLNAVDLNTYKFKVGISNKIIIDDSGLAYVKINNQDLIKYNISHSQAKRNVNLMKDIKGINIWVLFIEQEDQPDIFNASLRSNEIVINDIAEKFGGGGHKFASGIKNLNKEALLNLIENLKDKL